jgi:phage N-6-adenine-methyltransferase
MAKMPVQKPHSSKQDYETPPELIASVQRRFGVIDFDLAASPENAKALRFFTKTDDAIQQNWSLGPRVRVAWCNPEFAHCEDYAKKASEVRWLRRWTLLLVPMGTQDWACEFLWGKAYVLKLNGRVTFVGADQGYPKDLVLAVYGFGVAGEEVWDWRKEPTS